MIAAVVETMVVMALETEAVVRQQQKQKRWHGSNENRGSGGGNIEAVEPAAEKKAAVAVMVAE